MNITPNPKKNSKSNSRKYLRIAAWTMSSGAFMCGVAFLILEMLQLQQDLKIALKRASEPTATPARAPVTVAQIPPVAPNGPTGQTPAASHVVAAPTIAASIPNPNPIPAPMASPPVAASLPAPIGTPIATPLATPSATPPAMPVAAMVSAPALEPVNPAITTPLDPAKPAGTKIPVESMLPADSTKPTDSEGQVTSATSSSAPNTHSAVVDKRSDRSEISAKQVTTDAEPVTREQNLSTQQVEKLQSQIDGLKVSFESALELIKTLKESRASVSTKVEERGSESTGTAQVANPSPAPVSNKKREFKIVGASPDFLVVSQGADTKKIERGGVLPNGSIFMTFDGRTIVTSAGSYPVQ